MMIHVTEVEHVESYRLNLLFDNGEWRTIDLESKLWGEVFEPLKDVELFKQVKVYPSKDTVYWPNGADLAPEFLYAESTLINRTAA
jgi:Protein of unknown function (DUF2442)